MLRGGQKYDCSKIKEGVPLVQEKIKLLTSEMMCYDANGGKRTCTTKDLMGGVGESILPQNALDNSITDLAKTGTDEGLLGARGNFFNRMAVGWF